MKTLKYLKRDFNLGILKRWYIFVIPLIFAAAQVWRCNSYLGFIKAHSITPLNETVMDYLLYGMQGMNVFFFNPKEYFEIPIYWFVFQIGISYYTAYYAHKDFLEYGKTLFLASKDRTAWWRSKCLWCMLSVMFYYLITIFAVCAFAKCCGAKLSLCFTKQIMMTAANSNMAYVSVKDALFMTVIVPFVVTLAICILQLLLGLLISPVVSFVIVCIEYVLSAYYTCWYLIGSYTMWLRSSYVTMEGLNPLSGIVISVFIITLVYIWGSLHFTQTDIL